MTARFGVGFSTLDRKKIGPGSEFMKAFEDAKRNFEGKAKSKPDYWLPLKMRKLDEDDAAIHQFYDFEEDRVKITRYGLSNPFQIRNSSRIRKDTDEKQF